MSETICPPRTRPKALEWKPHPFVLRMPEEVFSWASAQAAREGRSINAVLLDAIARGRVTLEKEAESKT